MAMFTNGTLPFHRHSDILNATPTDDDSLVRLVEELKRRGNSAFQQKSYEEAEVLYSRAIEVNTSNPLKNQHIFYANRSASRCNMGKYEQALEDAELCIEQDSGYAKGFFRKAQALNKLKRYKDALAALEQAKAMEPSNKSIAMLYDQVKELSTKEVAPPAPVQAEPKKVTRVEVVKDTNKQPESSKKAPAAPEDVEMDEEGLTGNVRGYKRLADGRVTTYFNNELSDEAKRLIGDIAPKRVENVDAVQIKAVEGGSAWNQGNTFEEKDMSSWAKSRIEHLFDDLSVPIQENGLSGTVKVLQVDDLSGDASIPVVRGAKRHIFDYTFTLKCELCVEGEEQPTSGQLRFLDMSSDCGGDYDVEAVVPSRYQSASGKLLHHILSSNSSNFRRVLADRLAHFVNEFNAY